MSYEAARSVLVSPGLGFLVTAAEEYHATWKAEVHRLDSTLGFSLDMRIRTRLLVTYLFTRLLNLMSPRAHTT